MSPEIVFVLILVITIIIVIASITIMKKLGRTKLLFVIIPIIILCALICFAGLSVEVIREVKEKIGPGFPATF